MLAKITFQKINNKYKIWYNQEQLGTFAEWGKKDNIIKFHTYKGDIVVETARGILIFDFFNRRSVAFKLKKTLEKENKVIYEENECETLSDIINKNN